MSLQLSSIVKPSHYDIDLVLNLSEGTFKGKETISVEFFDDSKTIILNSSQLSIKSSKIGNEEVKIELADEDQELTIPYECRKGETARLYFEFEGKIGEHMTGIYLSPSEEGSDHSICSTQFEPTFCRTAFPCFDQPNMKAVFDLTLTVPKDLVTLSNMDVKEETSTEKGTKVVRFESTPVMSTYLVAFAVGNFKSVESKTSRIPIRVWTEPSKIDRTEFALEIAETALSFYEDIFAIPYPLPKLDMIAIPEFEKYAMENFGLITYQERFLLLNSKSASTNTKSEVAETVFHEVSHQWFGNLVTMEWWNDLWLNEGFADWMARHALNKFFPEWKPWVSYIVCGLSNSLRLDSLKTTHAVNTPFKTIQDINEGFDDITYDKGCALLTMVVSYVGVEKFLKSVSAYLKTYSWKNTTGNALWDAIEDETKIDIKSIMNKLLETTGFPLITVEEDEGSLVFTQSRFFSDGSDDEEVLYPVIINIKTSAGLVQFTLEEKSGRLELSAEDDFYKVNAESIGFFRTCYKDTRWTKLGLNGRDGKLSTEDLIGLLSDCQQLSSAGKLSVTVFLNLVKEWNQFRDENLWSEIINDLLDIQDVFIFDKDIFNGINAFLENLISEQLDDSFQIREDDSHEVNQLKALIFGTGYTVGNKSVVDYCRREFEDVEKINPDQRLVVFKCIAKYGGIEEYKKLLNLYKTSDDEDIEYDALTSLGRFEDQEILTKVLVLALDSNEVSATDINEILITMKNHPLGIKTMWKWLQDKWDEISERVEYGSSTHLHIINSCLIRLATAEQKSEVELFFKDKKDEFLSTTIDRSLERLSAKIKWSSRDSDVLQDWLKRNACLDKTCQ